MKITPDTITHLECECGEPMGCVRGGRLIVEGWMLPRTITGECRRCGQRQRWSPEDFFHIQGKIVASGKDSE